MRRELEPLQVAARLAELAGLYVPETIEEGMHRLARERPPDDEPFDRAVERRLAELRALDDLTRYLHHQR